MSPGTPLCRRNAPVDAWLVYQEVYEILSYMDKSTVMKIPLGILEEINEKRDINYISRINPEDLFNELNVERETIVFIAWLDYNYWANEQEKEELYKTFLSNQYEYEEDLKRRFYSTNKPMFFEERMKIQSELEKGQTISGDVPNNISAGEAVSAISENSLAILNKNFLVNLKNAIRTFFFNRKKKRKEKKLKSKQ